MASISGKLRITLHQVASMYANSIKRHLKKTTKHKINSYVKPQANTYITAYIWRRFLRIEACVGHLDNMLQLSGLLFNLGSEKESCRSNNLAAEKRNNCYTGITPDYIHAWKTWKEHHLHFCETW